MSDKPTNALVRKFFDPIMNAKDFASMRLWLREQDADELEAFVNFWNWSNFRAHEAIARQELARLRAMPTSPLDAIEARPGFGGVAVDLKMLWRWFWTRRKRRIATP